jgi:sugar-specific transcriptional regulator TrmB
LLARERRDAEGAKVRAVFERRMKSLQDKLAREHRELSQDQTELGARKREELLSGVESVFNFVIGRASRHAVAFGAQRRRQTQMAQEDVRETRRAIEQLDADLTAVAAEYKSALAEVSDKWMRALADMQDVLIAPKKSDIFVDVIAVAWVAG